MSWIPNAICISGFPYSQLSEFQADAVKYNCDLFQELEIMSRGPTTYTILQGSIIRETEKAVRFKIEMPGHFLDDEAFWFPLSQLLKISRSHSQELDEIECPDWLIEAKVNDLGKAAGD